MKTKILLIISIVSILFLSSCKKDETSKFDYPMETLYGIWEGTTMYVNDKWIDINKYPYTEFAFSIRFNSDGTYYGSGYFGSGKGTYTAEGKTIITYINGQEYARYTVKSLDHNQSELTMMMGASTMDIKVKKK